eukprot:1151946-Pelagomonas_calceolata.AAC.3
MSSKAQEVVVSRGKVLELLRPNEMGKLVTVVSTEVFGCIRALAPFRITGASTDYVIVGSDSGRGLGRSLTHVGTCSWGGFGFACSALMGGHAYSWFSPVHKNVCERACA